MDNRFRMLAITLVSLVVAASLFGAVAAAERVTVHNDKLYVACKGENLVQVVNVSTGVVDRVIPTGSQPYLIALSPDGTRALVANYDDGTVSVIDTASDAVINTFEVQQGPTGLAISRDGSRAYVSNAYGFHVSIYDVATGRHIVTILADEPAGLAAGLDGMLYVTDPGSNAILVVDPASGLISTSIPAGGNFNGITIASRDTALIASTTDSNVSFVNLTARNVTATVSAGNGPSGIALSPDGHTAYVTNMNGNTLAILDLDARALTATATVGKMPAGIAVNWNGSRIYVANSGGNSITVINASTRNAEATISTGKTPYGIAYVANTTFADMPADPASASLSGSGTNLVDFGLIALVLLFVAIAGTISYRFSRK